MQEISLGVFAVCIFLIGFVLGFFSLFLVAGIERWVDKREKKKAKEKEEKQRIEEKNNRHKEFSETIKKLHS